MKILIVEDDSTARYSLQRAIRGQDRTILEATNGHQGIDLIRGEAPDLVFLDLNMPEKDGLTVLKELKEQSLSRWPEIVVVTANESIEVAIECIRRGASDFIAKPYDVEQIRAIVARSKHRVELENQVAQMQLQLESISVLGEMTSVSPSMHRIFEQIRKAAAVKLPVLIRGESGTGKELVASELHRLSDRASGPFVAVNTAAISESLIESELFGHVRGAFTGADKNRDGVFRRANGGTLFLDEIGDMPSGVQTRLLRVLQEGVLTPVGSETEMPVDVRVISATHQDLEESISNKTFRSDLYYRLRGIEIRLPPLRSRREDIVLLANRFAGPDHPFSQDAISAMLEYAWPGNVRELKQRVEGAVAMKSGESISAEDVGLVRQASSIEPNGFEEYDDLPLTEAKELLVERFERYAIDRAMRLEGDNVSAAARRLGIHRQSLQQKLKDR